MFSHIARFELRYQLRSPLFLIGFALFFLMSFGATSSDNIQIGARGNVHVNAPYAILQTLGVMTVLGMFLVTAFVAGAVIRDDETGFAPMLRATRISKPAYVFGRFAGAVTVAFLALAAVPLGMMLGSFMPWLDPSTVGAFAPAHYLYALFVFALPTLLLMSACFFALATATRSLMWTYVGAVAALVLFMVARSYLKDQALDQLSALADPFGLAALTQATKYWTATERNTLLPALEGRLLWNRALWSTVALLMLALAYRSFRMDGTPSALFSRRHARTGADAAPEPAPAAAVGAPPQAPRRSSGWAQFLAVARFDAASVFRSPAFFVLIAIGLLNSYAGMRFASQIYGVPVYPVTRAMVQALQGSFEVIPLLIAIFYAGELVWRDRQHRMHEIVDASAAPDWAQLLPKIAAITAVLLATTLIAVLTAVLNQWLNGYTQFELSDYLLWFVLPQTISATQLAVLAVFVQSMVAHKMIGWAVMLVYVVATLSLVALGFEHNLYNFGGAPLVPLSDMNGQGHFWQGRAWFQAYWCAFALMLVVTNHALRLRGTETRLWPRLARLPSRLRGPAGAVLLAASVCWFGLGGWIFYNTNVLNEYRTLEHTEQRLAALEKLASGFAGLEQPRITAVTLDVKLFPRERRVLTEGSYLIENRGGEPISELHLSWPDPLRLTRLTLAGATLAQEFAELRYRVYRLDPALAPGEQRTLAFASELLDQGIRNDSGPQRVVGNGTFLENAEISPAIGADRSLFLKDRSKRRKHGLAPETRMARLEDESARATPYLRTDSDWVTADITLSTDADQVPVAPGVTVSDTTRDGRRTLVTRSEAPMLHGFSLQSARYQLQRREHAGVDLGVYYQRGHEYNIERMLDAMAASIDLFGEAFSPYQFSQARILEFPAYATFAQAFAGTIPFSESIGFVMRHDDPGKIDMVSYVTAHEIAHQWWGHQLVGADMQGSTMLSETFAQYSALLVMERLHGKEQIRQFLKYELDMYLRARGGELIEELPLARVENQPYIHYRKGSLAMYWLKEVVGEAVVNRSLRRMLAQYAFKAAPYARSTDFLRILREEAGPRHDALITDLFERITLVDARVSAATARRRDGRWELTMEIEARKLVADGKGLETEEPLDEAFEIGVFSVEPGKQGFNAAAVLATERRTLRSGKQSITLTLDREPRFAGVDPWNKRIDRNSEDNIAKVERQRMPDAALSLR